MLDYSRKAYQLALLPEEEIADRFIQALGMFERDGDVEPMMTMFAEGCVIETPIIPQPLHGRIEARAFWAGYRAAFRRIASTFRSIMASEGRVALEWTAQCTSRSGRAFHYDGASFLDISGASITRFRSYFDARQVETRMRPPARVN
jgi:ketosteroid isomerase-like protein